MDWQAQGGLAETAFSRASFFSISASACHVEVTRFLRGSPSSIVLQQEIARQVLQQVIAREVLVVVCYAFTPP